MNIGSFDECPIDAAAIKAAALDDDVVELDVTLQLERDSVASDQMAHLFGMLSFKAPTPTATAPTPTAPLDIVVCVDASGSMSGKKIELLQKTLDFVVTQMKPSDRLAIVKFNGAASVVSGLTRTDAANADKLINAIRTIEASGGTDIAEGVALSIKLLQQRKEQNPLTSILLLTDGQDSRALPKIEKLWSAAPRNCSLHLFGFGADHDATLLAKIAAASAGMFQYIETFESVGFAFATTLGGLKAICAVDLQVRISCVAAGASVVATHTKYESTLSDDGRVLSVHLPDLFQGESRDVVFSLAVPRAAEAGSAQELLHGTVSFSSPFGATSKNSAAPLLLARPAVVAPDAPLNAAVSAQRNRVRATEALDAATKLASEHNLAAARETLAGAIESINASASCELPLCKDLIKSLLSAKARLVDSRSFADGGAAELRGVAHMHAQQRTSAPCRGAPAPSAMYGYSAAQVNCNANYGDIVSLIRATAPNADFRSISTEYGDVPNGDIISPILGAPAPAPNADYRSISTEYGDLPMRARGSVARK
jgi:uncharacterized protein YegL